MVFTESELMQVCGRQYVWLYSVPPYSTAHTQYDYARSTEHPVGYFYARFKTQD